MSLIAEFMGGPADGLVIERRSQARIIAVPVLGSETQWFGEDKGMTSRGFKTAEYRLEFDEDEEPARNRNGNAIMRFRSLA